MTVINVPPLDNDVAAARVAGTWAGFDRNAIVYVRIGWLADYMERKDPTPADLVQRACEVLDKLRPLAEETPCACCGKPDRLGELDQHGRCHICLDAIGRQLDWIEGHPA